MYSSQALTKELEQLSGWTPDGEKGFTLGYLLRKLPESLDYNNGKIYLNVGVWWSGGWQAHYGAYDLRSAIADTPENATVKLCIELFKQGILKREAA